MEKKKTPVRRSRAFPALAGRIIALALAMWLCAMALITETAAIELVKQMKYKAQEYASYWSSATVNYTEEKEALPGYADYCRLHHMTWRGLFFDFNSSFPFFIKPPSGKAYDPDEYNMDYEFAAIYRDEDGNILQKSGEYLYFSYVNSQVWDAGEEEEKISGYSYIDLVDSGLGYNFKYSFMDVVRFTGYFEGTEFHPVTMDYCNRNSDGPHFPEEGETFSDWDRRNVMRWNNRYHSSQKPDQELVTIYSLDLDSTDSDYSEPFTVNGTEFSSMLELLEKNGIDGVTYEHHNIIETTAIAYGNYTDVTGQEVYTSVALRARPLAYTMSMMWPFYMISFLIAALAVFLILRSIRRNLIRPLNQVVWCSAGNPVPLSRPCNPYWREPRQLEENYTAAQQALREARAEVKQLETALEFAQNAEEHRRQMISNITHELKTPLAIIHSYAEGLHDGIAVEKQEQYLNVILEETRRMDAMVLEMLDLSRLEAGRVRLATDQVSLVNLTRTILEKLELAAQAKALSIEFGLAEDFTFTADESRIGQVITNFVTNAIKYSPEEGRVVINIFTHRQSAIFSIENQSQPLSDETLEKVWDSFYRADPSRTTKGTGLGLTIAKTIIDLHRGSCSVRNTSTGVEFRFAIPL